LNSWHLAVDLAVDFLLVDPLEIDCLTEALNLVSASEQRMHGWMDEGIHDVAYPALGLPVDQLKTVHTDCPGHLVLYSVLKMIF
jgi:hypothetical protein